MRIQTLRIALASLLTAALLAGCFDADTPLFYTCSAASPRCPDAMACVPISGLDSGMLTDWKYERTPAVCLRIIPRLDKGAAVDKGAAMDKGAADSADQ